MREMTLVKVKAMATLALLYKGSIHRAVLHQHVLLNTDSLFTSVLQPSI